MASLLESFKNFCEEHPNFVDFELTDKSYLAEGVEGITILGQHGSASEISCY